MTAKQYKIRRRRNRVRAFWCNTFKTAAVVAFILAFGFIGGTERSTISMLHGLIGAFLSFGASLYLAYLSSAFE